MEAESANLYQFPLQVLIYCVPLYTINLLYYAYRQTI